MKKGIPKACRRSRTLPAVQNLTRTIGPLCNVVLEKLCHSSWARWIIFDLRSTQNWSKMLTWPSVERCEPRSVKRWKYGRNRTRYRLRVKVIEHWFWETSWCIYCREILEGVAPKPCICHRRHFRVAQAKWVVSSDSWPPPCLWISRFCRKKNGIWWGKP